MVKDSQWDGKSGSSQEMREVTTKRERAVSCKTNPAGAIERAYELVKA